MKSPSRLAAVLLLTITASAASAHADDSPPLAAESTTAPTPVAPTPALPRSSEPVRIITIQPQPAPASGPIEPLPPPQLAPQPKTRRHWYGWQPLVTDGAALVLLVTALRAQESAFAYAALGSYVLGGPVFHLAHERPGAAAGSFALRAGLPLALGYGMYLLGDGGGSGNHGDAAITGIVVVLAGMLGVGTAIAIDAAVLSRETIDVEPEETSSFRLVPQLAVDPKGARFGLGGTF